MKSVFDMSGVERAAALLVALGPKVASQILKNLDEESIEKISSEIARIEKLSPEEREDLIGEFLIDLRKEKRRIEAGEGKARDLLVEAFGSEKADDIMNRFSDVDVDKEFENINEIEDDILAGFLKDELPQTIAVTLSFLVPKKSAAILKLLDPATAKKVAVKLAKMESVTPDAAAGVARAIKVKYKKYREQNSGLTAGGVDTLIGILGHMDREDEKNILASLDESMPSISGQIREQVYAFENVVNLSNTEIRILIDEINDDYLIARSLKGAGDDVRFKFLRNMSQNRATDIIEDMKAMGALRLSEINDSRAKIEHIMMTLHDNGIISLRKDEDKYVE